MLRQHAIRPVRADGADGTSQMEQATFDKAGKRGVSRRGVVLLAAGLVLGSLRTPAAQTVEHDFSFGRGAPFAGAALIAGVCVTLATTNTEPYGPTAFRDLTNTQRSEVTLTFSTPISAFHVDVSRVHVDEWLLDFSIGHPTGFAPRGGQADHSLVNLGGKVTTSRADDYGQGRLAWSGIMTDTVRFTIWNKPGAGLSPALAVDRFGFAPVRDGPAAGNPPPTVAGVPVERCPPRTSPADAGDTAGKPPDRAGGAAGRQGKLPIRDSQGWGVCGSDC